jgi:predicted nucleic acid-binding protein
LDRGEAEAIALAERLQADLLLMDERIGRRCARERSLRVVGLLGTLIVAKQRGLIAAVRPLVEQLRQQAGFYVSDTLLAEVLQRAGE